MPQTSYYRNMGPALPGQLADNNPRDVFTGLNKSGGALVAGIAVKFGGTTPAGGSAPVGGWAGVPMTAQGTSDGQTLTNLALTGDQIAGITALTFATDPYNISGTATYREGVTMDVMRRGSIFVAAEQSCTPGDSVNVRFAAVGSNTTIGAFTNTPDAGTRPVKGAAWRTKSVSAPGTNLESTAQNIAKLDFDALTDAATH